MLKVKRLGVVLKPDPRIWWEREAVFNPAVVYDEREGVVHLFYRAVAGYFLYTSYIGWAQSEDFVNFKRVSDEPIIGPESKYEYRGCEDPRVSYLPSVGYVMTYTAVDEVSIYRVGVAVARKLEGRRPFVKLGIRDEELQKGAVFFESSGRIYVIHRPERVATLSVLGWKLPLPKWLLRGELGLRLAEAGPGSLLKWRDVGLLMKPEREWERSKIGNGIPPLETDAGLLLIYHGVSENKVYRAGAALLSRKGRPRVIARLPYPILSPEEPYERYGEVANVVYPTGGFILDDELYIYYGAADMFVALAKLDLTELLSELDKYSLE